MSDTVIRKRWIRAADDDSLITMRPIGHYMHPNDIRTALCGAPILGIPTFEPFEICTKCKVYAAAGDWAPLPTSPAA